jgi:transcriptional regulator GlxA family with amidase domain
MAGSEASCVTPQVSVAGPEGASGRNDDFRYFPAVHWRHAVLCRGPRLRGVSAFGLGVTAEVFGCNRSGEGLPRYDYAVTAARPGLIRTDVGMPVLVEAGLDRLSSADLAVVVCWDDVDVRPPEPALQALRAVVSRGGRVLSQCTGAFVLAAAGLLDGRRATTHWKYADELARRYPQIQVDPGVLYLDEGQVITSAGTAAGIDACLHVVRVEHGAAVANEVARAMVVAPHRDGGQAQFVPVPVDSADRQADLALLRDWALSPCTSRSPSPT